MQSWNAKLKDANNITQSETSKLYELRCLNSINSYKARANDHVQYD